MPDHGPGKVGGDPRNRARSSIGLIVLVCLVIVAAFWIVSVFAIREERRVAIQHGENEAGNLAVAFRSEVQRSLDTVNETMDVLERQIRREGKGFDLHAWAAEEPLLANATIQISLIGPSGKLVQSSLTEHAKPIDLSDRPHFRVHLHGPAGKLFIGRPVLGRVSKKTTIQLSRRMNDARGNLLYVIVFSIEPRYLTTLNKSVYLGDSGVITLLGADDVVRARFTKSHPDGLDHSGKSIASAEFTTLRSAGQGSYTARSGLDDVERVFSFVQVSRYPLFVIVGLPLSDVLAAPRAFARLFIVLASLATLLVVLLALFLSREIWRGANRELALRETQEALQGALAAAEDANRAKSTFLAMMSHEIRTPMNGILGLTRSLLKSNLDRAQTDIVRLVRDSGTTLLRILNDIIDLTRLESVADELHPEDFSPATLTRSVAHIFAERARERELDFVVQEGTDPALVLRGDAGRIRQALWNLVSNAIKFTEAGSVTIVSELLESSETARTIRWTVTDTGIGIPADRVGSLFATFVQADSSIQRRYGGSGLGLAITKRLVESMGGTIDVTSTLGAGSSFAVTLRLPLGDPEARADDDGEELAKLIRERALRNNNAYHVLVAEDDAASRSLLATLLRDVNLRVETAADGGEALAKAGQTTYDMIFMDMQMPKVDGLTATQHLRESNAPCARVPIVGVTANVFAEDVARCKAAGMNDVIEKPVSEKALYRVIGSLLPESPHADRFNGAVAPSESMGPAPNKLTPRQRVMPIFLTSTVPVLDEIHAAAEARDTVLLARLAHRLKSSSLAIDATQLADICRRLEIAGVRDDAEAALAEIEPLAEEYERTCAAVRAELAAQPG